MILKKDKKFKKYSGMKVNQLTKHIVIVLNLAKLEEIQF